MNAHGVIGCEAQILSEMARAGIEVPPPDIVADGKIHRFASRVGSKKPNGWYVVHPDRVIATWAFGDWSLDISESGQGNPGRPLTVQELAEWRRRRDGLQAKVSAEKAIFQEDVAIESQQRWDGAKPAIDHEYLQKKRIDPCGVRIAEGRLLIPMRDIGGKLWSLQEIFPSGDKSYPKNGRVGGCFFQIGEIKEVLCIGEGFATCATLHMATGYPAAAAFAAGNLEAVAVALRKKYPDARIIVCGDDDWLTRVKGKPHNAGRIAAEKTANAVGGVLSMPLFNGSSRPQWATDFNDMERLHGAEEVRQRIRLDDIEHEDAQQKTDDVDMGVAAPENLTTGDFYAFMPMHNYIFIPTCDTWPAASVDARVPPVPLVKKNGEPLLDKKGNQRVMAASAWLDRHRPVSQLTWAPGLPALIKNRVVADSGWIDHAGSKCFNTYRPPSIKPGDAGKAGRWRDHLYSIYPDEGDHIERWFAHRVQRPDDKINHAIVLGGRPGIGKDTLIEALKYSVGAWNFSEASPQDIMGRFNSYVKSVVLRISEARDLGEFNRYQFYDRMKTMTAAPPDALPVDEKHIRRHYVPNCCGVIITLNDKINTIYLPPEDRRHLVAWSAAAKELFGDNFWLEFWDWYKNEGLRHVAAHLAQLDISKFNPKAPPPKTDAFWTIADSNRAPEESEMADVLDRIGNPVVVTIDRIMLQADGELTAWMNDRKNRRIIPIRLEKCGYEPIRNDAAKDGLWKIGDKRRVVYGNIKFPKDEQLREAESLTGKKEY